MSTRGIARFLLTSVNITGCSNHVPDAKAALRSDSS